MHLINGQTNICAYINQPARLLSVVWERLENRINLCWDWVLNTQIGQTTVNPLWQRYIVPLNQLDKSYLQKISIIVLTILFLGRPLCHPALTPIIFLIPAFLLGGGYKLIKSRVDVRSNLQIIPRLDQALTVVRQSNEDSNYPEILDMLKNEMIQPEYPHLRKYVDSYDAMRKAFKKACERRSIATIRQAIIQFTHQQGINQLPVVINFIDALNAINGQNEDENARTALQARYQEVVDHLNQDPNQNQAQQSIRWLSRQMAELNQPTFESSQTHLIERLDELRRKLHESPHPLMLITHAETFKDQMN